MDEINDSHFAADYFNDFDWKELLCICDNGQVLEKNHVPSDCGQVNLVSVSDDMMPSIIRGISDVPLPYQIPSSHLAPTSLSAYSNAPFNGAHFQNNGLSVPSPGAPAFAEPYIGNSYIGTEATKFLSGETYPHNEARLHNNDIEMVSFVNDIAQFARTDATASQLSSIDTSKLAAPVTPSLLPPAQAAGREYLKYMPECKPRSRKRKAGKAPDAKKEGNLQKEVLGSVAGDGLFTLRTPSMHKWTKMMKVADNSGGTLSADGQPDSSQLTVSVVDHEQCDTDSGAEAEIDENSGTAHCVDRDIHVHLKCGQKLLKHSDLIAEYIAMDIETATRANMITEAAGLIEPVSQISSSGQSLTSSLMTSTLNELRTTAEVLNYFASITAFLNEGNLGQLRVFVNKICAPSTERSCTLHTHIIKVQDSAPLTNKIILRDGIADAFISMVDAFPDMHWKVESASLMNPHTIVGNYAFKG
jgi:uncharacterized protein YoxC